MSDTADASTLVDLLPSNDDCGWPKSFRDIPTITFGTIYAHLVGRNVLMSRVSALEDIADDRAKQNKPDNGTKEDLE